jgi:hypothetical protein
MESREIHLLDKEGVLQIRTILAITGQGRYGNSEEESDTTE